MKKEKIEEFEKRFVVDEIRSKANNDSVIKVRCISGGQNELPVYIAKSADSTKRNSLAVGDVIAVAPTVKKGTIVTNIYTNKVLLNGRIKNVELITDFRKVD